MRKTGWWFAADAVEQFLETVERTERCWLWTGSRDKEGYGRLTVAGRSMPAARMAFWLFHGWLPPGLLVMHSCDNPPCVNPAHLSAGSPGENQRDRIHKRRIGRVRPPTRPPRGDLHRPLNWIDRADAKSIFLSTVAVSGDDECWPWLGARKTSGHGIVIARGHRHAAYRIAYELFRGPIPDGAHVLHQCDNGRCVNPRHLTLGDHQRNMAEAVERGRFPTGDAHWTHRMPERLARGERHRSRTKPESVARGDEHWSRRNPELARATMLKLRGLGPKGSAHPQSKLTEAIVLRARERYATEGGKVGRLAAEYGVSRKSMRDAIHGVTWSHICPTLAAASNGHSTRFRPTK